VEASVGVARARRRIGIKVVRFLSMIRLEEHLGKRRELRWS
jgi:hypothetical protein